MAFVFNKAEFDTKSGREAAEVFPRLMSVDGSVAVVLMESHCFVLALLYYQLLFCNVVNTALACYPGADRRPRRPAGTFEMGPPRLAFFFVN